MRTRGRKEYKSGNGQEEEVDKETRHKIIARDKAYGLFFEYFGGLLEKVEGVRGQSRVTTKNNLGFVLLGKPSKTLTS